MIVPELHLEGPGAPPEVHGQDLLLRIKLIRFLFIYLFFSIIFK